ncbi:MAG TPA: ABC transporter permease, partial [Candidatus Cryosericum sp.]|nr:ABC transporter permease [Candidatus Cryosericum sp.]
METLVQDLRFGLRMLLKSPGFTLSAILALALGIGANTAIFSMVNGVLLRSLPYQKSEQLVTLRQHATDDADGSVGFSVPDVMDYREQSRSLSGVVEYHTMWFNLIGTGEPQRVQTGVVSADFFDVMGVRPVLGRTFVAGDDTQGAEAVLVLSYGYWQRAFGGEKSVIGRTVEMNDRVHTIVGVLPPVPQYPN